MDAARARVEGLAAGLDLGARGGYALVEFVEGGASASAAAGPGGLAVVAAGGSALAHAIGTDWPACT